MSIANEITRLREAKEKLKLYSIGKISHPASKIDVVAQELLEAGGGSDYPNIRKIFLNRFKDTLVDCVKDGMLTDFSFKPDEYVNMDCVINYRNKSYNVFKHSDEEFYVLISYQMLTRINDGDYTPLDDDNWFLDNQNPGSMTYLAPISCILKNDTTLYEECQSGSIVFDISTFIRELEDSGSSTIDGVGVRFVSGISSQ